MARDDRKREAKREIEREEQRSEVEHDIAGEWGQGYGGGYGRSGHYGERGGPGLTTRGPQSGEPGGDDLPERVEEDDER